MLSIDPAAAFTGQIKRPGVGFFYTIGLAVVTLIMALMPVIYLALIGLVIYATYYHAVHHYGIMVTRYGNLSVRLWILKFFIYGAPIFIGTIVSLFMLKPLFARHRSDEQPYALNPENEPLLYGFIAKICELVGAPMPRLIELDCHMNASASLRKGFGSFVGRDLTLRIGLPLVAGLTVAEFAAVIAHEFGHFRQGLAMRLSYIVHRIDFWFMRVIYERDAWDEMLEEMTNSEETWLTLTAALAIAAVGLSRQVLKLLMLCGHGANAFLSRQMEYQADLFAIRLAGSETFEAMIGRLNTLNVLTNIAFKQIHIGWNNNKRLPDSIPQLLINKEGEFGEEVERQLKGQLGSVKTKLFDMHPSDAERVRAARLERSPGIVQMTAPARELFGDFNAAARIVTQLYYQDEAIPIGLSKIYEVPVAPVADNSVAGREMAARMALDRFFFGVVSPLRPIFGSTPVSVSDANLGATLEFIAGLPQQVSAVAEPVGTACAAFDHADQMMLAAASDPAGIAEGADASAWRVEKAKHLRSLHSIMEACDQRFASALAIASTAAFANKSVNAREIRAQANSLRADLQELRPAIARVDDIRIAAKEVSAAPDDPIRIAHLREVIADAEAGLRETPSRLADFKGQMLFNVFIADPATHDQFLVTYAEMLADFIAISYHRFLAEGAQLCEQIVESVTPS
jgi:Zn-dependent protease with chaperone function